MKRLVYIICSVFLFACATRQPQPHKLGAGDIGVDATFHNLQITGVCVGCNVTGGTLSGFTNFGSQSIGTQTCPNTNSSCAVTLTGNSVTIDAAPPVGSSAILIWQIGQDNVGGHPVAWSSAFHFAVESGGTPGIAPTPILLANKTEQFEFFWNSQLLKWDYESRGGIQALALTHQGGSSAVGGPSNSTDLPNTMVANVFNSMMSDNGGFLSPEGGGVSTYFYLTAGAVALCNNNSTTEYYSTYCFIAPGVTRVSSNQPLDGNACVNIPFFPIASNLPGLSQFGSFNCFVDPTANMQLTYHDYWTEEVPIN